MTVTLATRRTLHERAMGCCEVCGEHGATNAHHRANRSQGGGDDLANLLLVCGSGTTGCHGWITTNPLLAVTGGYTVLAGQAPAEVAVLRWSRYLGWAEWVLLDEEGCLTPTEEGAQVAGGRAAGGQPGPSTTPRTRSA